MAAGLAEGVKTLSANQQIVFTQYHQFVLPLDGYVFYVNTGATITAMGSLHKAINSRQNEDETISINAVVFTSLTPVDEFNEVAPTTLLVGEWGGVRFSFNRQGKFYEQAQLYHYTGDAIYPALASQIIDDPSSLDQSELIVSNSLPAWLSLNRYMPMYPSFLVPANVVPPYAAVHIEPSDTEALQAFPSFDNEGSHFQLASDRVKIIIYGMTNNECLDFQDYVNTYSLNTDNIGVQNMPVMRDEKRTQSEISAIAMKKSIEYQVSYYQTRINDVARQLIESAKATFYIRPDPY
jgi:hypothetical protein